MFRNRKMMWMTSDDVARGYAKEKLRFKVFVCIRFYRKAAVTALIIESWFQREKNIYFAYLGGSRGVTDRNRENQVEFRKLISLYFNYPN